MSVDTRKYVDIISSVAVRGGGSGFSSGGGDIDDGKIYLVDPGTVYLIDPDGAYLIEPEV